MQLHRLELGWRVKYNVRVHRSSPYCLWFPKLILFTNTELCDLWQTQTNYIRTTKSTVVSYAEYFILQRLKLSVSHYYRYD